MDLLALVGAILLLLVRAILLLAILSGSFAYLCWTSHVEPLVLTPLLVRELRKKLGGAPVRLSAVRLRRGHVELRGLRIDNGPGQWTVPCAMSLSRLRVGFRGLCVLRPCVGSPPRRRACLQ